MAIINRVSRLFKADMHAVLDRMEEPDVLLKQAVREMEDDLNEREHEIKCMTLDQSRLLERQSDLEQSVLSMDEELALCFASDNDDLARSLIKRKLEVQQCLKVLLRKREALDKAIGEYQALLKEDYARYESMRQKSELLSEEMKSYDAGSNDLTREKGFECSIGGDEVEIAYLKERQRFEDRKKVKGLHHE